MRPPAVIVASRAEPELASTENPIVPEPDPLPPDVTCTHGCDALAVHGHPAPVVTAIDPVPPPDAKDWLSGLMVKVQPPACVTVNPRPAIVRVAERCAPVLASTLKRTSPEPVPLAP